MKPRRFFATGKTIGAASALALALAIVPSSPALASGHFMSGLQGQFPQYDTVDTWVFQSSRPGYTSIIASVNPSAPLVDADTAVEPFGEGGLYNIHIATDDSLKNGMTFVFSFLRDAVEVRKIGMPNADVGTRGDYMAGGRIGSEITLDNGVHIWTGRGIEPFFGNGKGWAAFSAAKQAGAYKPELFKPDGDLFVKSHSSFIVLDIPNSMLGGKIGVFQSTAVNYKGEWRQVDRHAQVLIPYIFLADTHAEFEDHTQHRPDSDAAERRQAVVNNVFWSTMVANPKLKNPMQYAQKIGAMMMPDILHYRVGTPARYAVGDLNGRALSDDAMNTVLELMMSVPIDDYAYDQKRYSTQFPYIRSQ